MKLLWIVPLVLVVALNLRFIVPLLFVFLADHNPLASLSRKMQRWLERRPETRHT